MQNAQLLGTTEAYETVHDIYVEQGPLPVARPTSSARRAVAVIGTDIAEALFPFVDPSTRRSRSTACASA